jgi:hypothetical protein
MYHLREARSSAGVIAIYGRDKRFGAKPAEQRARVEGEGDICRACAREDIKRCKSRSRACARSWIQGRANQPVSIPGDIGRPPQA